MFLDIHADTAAEGAEDDAENEHEDDNEGRYHDDRCDDGKVIAVVFVVVVVGRHDF